MVLVFLFSLIAVLKVIDAEKLRGYFLALFNRGFIEDEVEEDTSFFNSFYGVLFVFSSTVLALTISLFAAEKSTRFPLNFSSFLSILGIVFGYLIVKNLLEVVITRLFFINKQLRFFVISKLSYLYSISFFLLIFYIVFLFSPLNTSSYIYIASVLFLLRFVFHARNNKNLIFSELFYFILYICALEIAPLLTLFKLML